MVDTPWGLIVSICLHPASDSHCRPLEHDREDFFRRLVKIMPKLGSYVRQTSVKLTQGYETLCRFDPEEKDKQIIDNRSSSHSL